METGKHKFFFYLYCFTVVSVQGCRPIGRGFKSLPEQKPVKRLLRHLPSLTIFSHYEYKIRYTLSVEDNKDGDGEDWPCAPALICRG